MEKSKKILNEIIKTVDADSHFLRRLKRDIKTFAKEYHSEQLNLSVVIRTFTEKEKETLILLLHSEIQETKELHFNTLDTQEYINHHSKLIEKIEKSAVNYS